MGIHASATALRASWQQQGKTVVSFFHTHPNTTNEGYILGPSPDDTNFSTYVNLPGIVEAHDGVHYFGANKYNGSCRSYEYSHNTPNASFWRKFNLVAEICEQIKSLKMRIIKIILGVQAALLFVSCGNHMKREEGVPKQKLLEITKAYLADNYPSWTNSPDLPATFVDRGGFWEVSFMLPPGTIGGTPVVEIDKQSYKVLKAYHTQ